MSRFGRGDAPPSRPSRPARQGSITYPAKVVVSLTQGAQRVSGLRSALAANVTGAHTGANLPVSGTQYIAQEGGGTACPAALKVGHARTPGGLVVSGTLVRSRVAVTGDEAGLHTRITGEADQLPLDDLSQRRQDIDVGFAPNHRARGAQGSTLFGAAAARSAFLAGSRERDRQAAVESTQNGRVITGSALGRSVRVTGDESGACRHLTGDQYLSPARGQAECGGRGGGTGVVEHGAGGRADPVTGAKVVRRQTWRGQTISGSDVEHDPRVTGDEPGSCALLTGTPYQGPSTVHGWCPPERAQAVEHRQVREVLVRRLTGDIPGPGISGTARGSERDITGTPYGDAVEAEDAHIDGDLVSIDSSFSVSSPMRSAQLRRAGDPAAGAEQRITGAFAVGSGKITGNLEFLFRPRIPEASEEKPAHARLTGEGSRAGRAVTGDAWAEHRRVTGTEGRWSAGRSPTERAGKANAIGATSAFQKLGRHDEPRQIVTGMVGWSSKSAAKVTLSGGAQG